jgi:signal transduction histidine kinase
MLNSLFEMNEQSSNSMQQLYLDDKKLFSSLAHRLKTPVAILRGQLLHNSETKDDQELLRPLDEITAAINELTVLSKMNLSKALATKQRLDLRHLLQEIEHDSRILAANHERLHNQVRTVTYSPNNFKVSPVVYIAPQQLKEALLNIIDNSIRHNPGKEQVNVSISLSSRQKKYCICIQDDGVGMTEEQLKNILSKYTVVKETDSPIDMHVGLEISRNLIRANGGDLFIYSENGRGTTVEIMLKGD